MSLVLTPVKTSLMAEKEVSGPRNGKSDPENAYMDPLPVLSADPLLDIPPSNFALANPRSARKPKEASSSSSSSLASLAPVAELVADDVSAARLVHRSKAPRLAAAAAASERKQNELAKPPQSDNLSNFGGVWQELMPTTGVQTLEVELSDALAGAGGGRNIVGDGAGGGGGGQKAEPRETIEKPMEGMLISDFGARERAWRGLAKKLYDQQPPFLDRGKQRWNGLVDYDHKTDTVMWNRKSLPNSSLFKSTFNHADGKPNLGQVILVLMEKNESKIIERMLQSIIDDIDGFIILDTGSTDGTEQVMWDFLVTKHDKKGAIYKTDWYDFGTNRTITVQLAHGMGDWLVLMDADYRLERENKVMPQFWKNQLPALDKNPPAWLLLKTTGDLDYARPHVVLGSVRWCYVCRTHEYLSKSIHDKSTANFRQETFPALMIDHVGDGQSKADKMGRDIVLLIMDAMDDPKSERAPFYLANTLKQIRMVDWALRSYKQAMNLCGWNEEIYMSAKGALECMFVKTPAPSFERQLGMALHGMTTNPERLELLAMFVRRVRMSKDWWPKYSHLCSSLMALFTHNVYPSHQKLFIERPEHEFGLWQEASICSYYNLMYFEFGLHMSHKVVGLPAFKQQGTAVQQQNMRNMALYDQRLNEWRQRGVRVSQPIRKYLIEQGHRAMAQGKYAKAKEWYQYVLHAVVLADLVPDHLLTEAQTPQERQAVNELCDSFSSPTFHKFHRITAWQNAKCLTQVVTDIDHDRALVSFQMGQCQFRLDSDNRILTAMYYVDAIKWFPGYPPAVAALYELTLMKSSDLTRAITYLIRLVSLSTMTNACMPLLKHLKSTIEQMAVDQSEWAHIVSPNHLPGTPWLIPIAPKTRISFAKSVPNLLTNKEPWMNIIEPVLHTKQQAA